jgi:DNA-binding NarL/FixJ family response regulator
METSENQPIRVLIVDDHAVVRTGLRLLLNQHPTIAVVGETASIAQTLAFARQTPVDLILLDLDLNGENGLDAIAELLAIQPRARILVLTGVTDGALHRRAVRAGASGLVLKEKGGEVVVKAIEKVQSGELWFERGVLSGALREVAGGGSVAAESAKIEGLTEREREVIRLLSQGKKNKQIAEELYISETTVRHHLTSIFDKLGVEDRLELSIYAFRHGLAKVPE